MPTFTLKSSPNPLSRHYVYVGDVAAAFDTVTHSGVDGEIYNIGCHEEFTNMQACETVPPARTTRNQARARGAGG